MQLSTPSAGPVLLDGAMGTELIERGLDIRADIAERWVLERPDEVWAVHRSYVEAGAQALQTCTFGALRTRLAPHGLQLRVTEVCHAALSVARSAADGRPVIASLGPTGAVLRAGASGLGAQIETEVAEAASALAAADVIHLETQLSPEEVVASAAGVRRGAPGVPLWISVTLMTGASGLETPHGVPLARMLKALGEARPDAVGVNCSLDADRIRDAVERLVDANLGPVVARPQARISEKCATGRSSETPTRFAERAARLFDLGAAAVGGCCGTSPASIAALAAVLSGHAREPHGPVQKELTR